MIEWLSFTFTLGASLIAQLVKNPPTMQGTPDWFLGWEDSLEKRKSYPLQDSGLENPLDSIVHGVAKSQIGLSDFHFHFCFPGDSVGKESACHAGDPGSIPGSGRSPGEGNGNPLQYSCLENLMDRRAWRDIVHGVAKSRTWLRN